jgi:hypothetical protein
MNRINRPHKIVICLVGISVLAFVTYIAVHAQSNNTIQGCYSDGSGSLRRVNSPSDCKNSETPISWNVQGPQGPPGTSGGFAGISGRWEGTLIITSPQCSNLGSNPLSVIFIQLPSGDVTGSAKVFFNSVSSSVFGNIAGSNITFDSGGAGVVFNGTLTDANNMGGNLAPVNPTNSCPQGTWTAQRAP